MSLCAWALIDDFVSLFCDRAINQAGDGLNKIARRFGNHQISHPTVHHAPALGVGHFEQPAQRGVDAPVIACGAQQIDEAIDLGDRTYIPVHAGYFPADVARMNAVIREPYRAPAINIQHHLLRTFIAVAAARTVTKAAAVLHLTQPAVSGHLRVLEDELQLKLFERGTAGMRLTRAGELLLPHAQSVTAAVDQFKLLSSQLLNRKVARARLGTILDPEFLRVGALLAAVVEKHPLLDVELQHGITTVTVDKLLKGELDAGFGLGQIEDARIECRWLTDVNHVVVYPSNWAARLKKIDWPALARMPWIYPPEHSPQRRLLVGIFERYRLTPLQSVQADQESTMSSLVAAGVGLSIMREDLARVAQQRGQVRIWSPGHASAPLYFIHSASRSDDPVVVSIREAALALWDPLRSALKKRKNNINKNK